LCGLAVVGLVGVGSAQTPPSAPALPVAPAAPAPIRTAFAARGAGSCSATACHGSARPLPGSVVTNGPATWVDTSRALRNEHRTWVTTDPHAEAYQVLLNDRSKAIAKKLNGDRLAAHEDRRCLACHSNLSTPASPEVAATVLRDGVGCESCHGPADRWISEHTRLDWAGRDPAHKAGFGMLDTRDLASRARACAGCHVGSPPRDGYPLRDVDHDLIAAGHPRLNFEFSAFHDTMPHHWRTDVGPDATADFPARAWAVGQVVAAQAALDLLSDRAGRAGGHAEPSAWPEFSELDCFACHHSLRDQSFRRDREGRSTPLGLPRWGTWYYPMLETFAAADPNPDGQALLADLRDLRRAMDVPRPDPADVAAKAGKLSERLGRWLDTVARPGSGYDEARVRKLLSGFDDLQKTGAVRTWDEATQRYLTLVPLSQALRSLAPAGAPNRTDELERLRDSLDYPPGFDSPKSFDPTAAPRR
jgi:hypothetical protein